MLISRLHRVFPGLALIALVGCSSQPAYEIERVPVEYEYVSREDDLMSAIQDSSTRFSVPLEDAKPSWDRAKLFFQQYLDMHPPEPQKFKRALLLSNEKLSGKNNSRYVFQVLHSARSGRALFEVRCYRRGDRRVDADADRNAKNLARFLKDGQLERSVLAF